MAEAARAEKVVFVLMLTARRLTSGEVAARRRAPASLEEMLVMRSNVQRIRDRRRAYSTSLKRSVSIIRFLRDVLRAVVRPMHMGARNDIEKRDLIVMVE
jgi:hypothetical protein